MIFVFSKLVFTSEANRSVVTKKRLMKIIVKKKKKDTEFNILGTRFTTLIFERHYYVFVML